MTGARIQAQPDWRYLVGVDTVVNVVASFGAKPMHDRNDGHGNARGQ